MTAILAKRKRAFFARRFQRGGHGFYSPAKLAGVAAKADEGVCGLKVTKKTAYASVSLRLPAPLS